MFGFCIEHEEDNTLTDEWGYLLQNFQIPFWVRGKTYLKLAQKGKLPQLPVVLVSPEHSKGETNLVDFEHPEECIYWFGGTHSQLKRKPKGTVSSIYIPIKEEVFSPTAGAIVIWDRILKNG